MDPTLRNNLAITEARTYLNCKWRHRGRSHFGIDCIGLIVNAMAAADFHMNDRLDYSRTPFKDGLEKELQDHFGEPVSDLKAGDVVLMKWDGDTEPSHVGLIAEDQNGLTIIHSYSMISVSEHCISADWFRRIVKTYRPFK